MKASRVLTPIFIIPILIIFGDTSVFAQTFPGKAPAVIADKGAIKKPAEPVKSKKKKEKPNLIVFNIVPEKGMERGESNLLTELVIEKVSSLNRFTVIGQKDLDKMLSWEQTKQLQGCTDTSCLIQIAGAMGADLYIEGSIGVFGGMYIVTLKLVDTCEVKVLARDTDKLEKNEEKLIATVELMVVNLMKVTEPQQKAIVEAQPQKDTGVDLRKQVTPKYPMNPYKMWGHASFWTGLGMAGLGGMFTGLAANAANNFRQSGTDKDAIARYNGAAISFYTIGGALVVTGVVLWALSPGDEEWAKKHKLSVAPIFDPKGAGLALGGEW